MAICPFADRQQIARFGAALDALAQDRQRGTGLFAFGANLRQHVVRGIGQQVMHARFVKLARDGFQQPVGQRGDDLGQDIAAGGGSGDNASLLTVCAKSASKSVLACKARSLSRSVCSSARLVIWK